MTNENDHDVLVSLKTLMEVMITSQKDFIKSSDERHAKLDTRISLLESSDSKDSERFKGIAEQITRSLDNSTKIATLQADLNNLGESLRDLKAKSNLWDVANAVGASIAGAIGWFK